MRSISIVALFALSLLPVTAFAQASPQPAAADSSATAGAAPSRVGGLTREQFIQHAEERAARRAAAQFDRIDTDHDGVLDPAEMRAWRSQRSRAGSPAPDRASPQ
jgi:hypothetical protein